MLRGIGDFFESRLGLRTFWRSSMTGKHPPQGVGFLRTIGFAALTVALLQIASGIALAFHYVPSADLAYDSILALEQDVPFGAEVRSLHHFGASAFVILAALHMLRVFLTGAYKKPRELTWVTGVMLLLIVLGFGFTGYLLPWDQKAYFATKVGTEIAGKAPYVGAHLREILNGGDTVGPPTLTRFYVIHVVLLPLGLLMVLGLHLFLIQRHGVAAPGRPVGDEGRPGPPYFPDHVLKEALVGIAVAGVLFGLSFNMRAPLEALAEPSDTSYQPRPDWYFLGLFELLKVFKGERELIGTVWLPNLSIAALFLLPFVDRSRERSWKRRPIMITIGGLAVLAVAGLTVMGALDQPKNDKVLGHRLGYTDLERQGYLLTRRCKCTDCHAYGDVGGNPDLPDTPGLHDIAAGEILDIVAVLEDVEDVLGEDSDMPDFSYLSDQERHAIAVFLQKLPAPAKK